MRPDPEKVQSKKDAPKPLVYVYGGGVAGMTAAHELAIRGFKVHVYERERALGPRGALDDPTLGGMARTQYFATTSRQQLYFHMTPLGQLIHQLLRTPSKALQAGCGRGTRRLLRTFFDMLWEYVLSSGDKPASKLLISLGKVLEGDTLKLFLEEFQGRALLESDFLSLLAEPPASLRTFIEGIRGHLRCRRDESTRKKTRQALASALSRALAGRRRVRASGRPGGRDRFHLRMDCLKRIARVARMGSLPEQLAFVFQVTLRSLLPTIDPLYYLNQMYRRRQPGELASREMLDRVLATQLRLTQAIQADDSGENFPECWLEFAPGAIRGAPLLTPESETVLNVALGYVKSLIDDKQFHTEAGYPTDVKILVQSFDDISQTALGVLADEGGRECELGTLAKRAAEMIQQRFAQMDTQVNVQVYKKTGGFLHTRTPSIFAPAMRNWVRVVFFRPQLPGEHGYRFFPSYYRHVFDTMRRIPLQAAPGRPPGGTVLDNLVPLPEIGIFSERSAPFIMNWTPPPPGAASSLMDYNSRNLASLRVTPRDLLQFSLRVLRYMTSCSRRRAREMEEVSWWDYLEGHEPDTGSRLYRYSEDFAHLVKSSSRVLAAFDGANGDARTCGNTYVQLLTQALVPTEHDNCTLNGPTTEAWFTHWRRYLEELEVEFHHGELLRFEYQREWKKEVRKGAKKNAKKEAKKYAEKYEDVRRTVEKDVRGEPRLVAHVRRFLKSRQDFGQEVDVHGDEKNADAPVYFVVATDLCAAAAVTRFLDDDMSQRLHAFAHRVPRAPRSEAYDTRNPKEATRREAWDRLQTIAGIQFFFQKHVNVFDGYIYCVDAEWRLSAISSHLVWRERPTGSSLQPYQSILSVDIGDWNTPSKYLGIPACECTPEQLRDEVLRQLRASLSTRGAGRDLDGSVLPEPDWVHIDESLEYQSHVDEERPRHLLRNNAPYLVPIAGDWKHRPGPHPWDPSPESDPAPLLPYGKHLWQAPHGGYPVHYDRLVFAGTYLKTFTRMTTMESANESARHAVNAILDHYTAHHASAPRDVWRASREPRPSVFNPYERGLYPTSPQGDYCRIWDPEQNELPDFELLQQQDEEHFLQGRPHPMDALGLEVLPSLLSQSASTGESFDQLLKWVATRGAVAPQATQGLLAVLRHLRTMLESARPPRGY